MLLHSVSQWFIATYVKKCCRLYTITASYPLAIQLSASIAFSQLLIHHHNDATKHKYTLHAHDKLTILHSHIYIVFSSYCHDRYHDHCCSVDSAGCGQNRSRHSLDIFLVQVKEAITTHCWSSWASIPTVVLM